MTPRDSIRAPHPFDDFNERQHLLDSLAAPVIGYLAYAASIGGQDSQFQASPQIIVICKAIMQLSNAVDVERALIGEYWDRAPRDFPLEFKTARAVVKRATGHYLAALHRAMFSPGALGIQHGGDIPSTLRSAAEFADLILDRVELISLWGRLGIALQAERSWFDEDGVGPELLALCAKRASLQAETAAALRGYFERWAFKPVRDKRTAALLRSMAGDPDKIGMMILSAVCGVAH